MKSFEVWAQGQGQHPTIEEDQIVRRTAPGTCVSVLTAIHRSLLRTKIHAELTVAIVNGGEF
jgi:hypothetical protein